jgi:hypothetical protein
MYIGIAQGDPAPSSGNFHIIDGDFGQRAVDISLEGYTGSSPVWKASDGSGGYVNFTTIGFAFNTPYFLSFTVDPLSLKYSATISQVSTTGAVLQSQTLSNLSIGASMVSNHANGQLLVHVEGSAGNTLFKVDNLEITDLTAIPEPGATALLVAGTLGGYAMLRRRRATS